MKNLSKIIFIILGIILCSCKKENQPLSLFSSAETLKDYEILDLDKYDILSISQFCKEENYITIGHNKDSTMLTLVDINTGHFIKGITKGRGPNELTTMQIMGIKNGILYVNDINAGKICDIYIKECFNSGKITYQIIDVPQRLLRADVNSDYVIGQPIAGINERFAAYNRITGESSYYTEYPDYTDGFPPKLKKSSEDKSIPKFRKGHNDFVYYNRLGGMLSIWKIEDNEIKLYKDLIFHLPKIHFDAYTLKTDKDNKLGFQSVCTSVDYIFGSYEGLTREESKKKSWGTEHLLVFDWDGNPVKRYILPLTILVSSYDEEEDTIYGLNYDGETKIVKYKLDLKSNY